MTGQAHATPRTMGGHRLAAAVTYHEPCPGRRRRRRNAHGEHDLLTHPKALFHSSR